MKKIKFLLFIILLFIFIPSVNAKVTTYARNDQNNYGVNKKWEITDKNKANVLRTPLVDASEKIYDFSGVLTNDEIQTLKAKIDEFREKYNTEIVIVTYSLPYTNDSENEDFAADFYDYNDFGKDYEKYDGILLFRNTYEADPYYDMYTFGDAQLYFTHAEYDRILDGIYNNLHAGNYLYGFSSFINYVTSDYENGIPWELRNYRVDENGYLYKIFAPSYVLILLGSILITFIFIRHNVKKNKMVKKAVQAAEYLDKDSVKYSVREDKFIKKHLSSYTISSGSSGGGGGYSSSGGSSGGGHSSGGGRHG